MPGSPPATMRRRCRRSTPPCSRPSLTAELRGEVHLDRARVRVAENNVAAARTELDRALELVPADPFAWYLSAALARRENNLARAGTDIARARSSRPTIPTCCCSPARWPGWPAIWRRPSGSTAGSPKAAPDSDAGRQARESLATLREIEVPAPASTPAPAPQPR